MRNKHPGLLNPFDGAQPVARLDDSEHTLVEVLGATTKMGPPLFDQAAAPEEACRLMCPICSIIYSNSARHIWKVHVKKHCLIQPNDPIFPSYAGRYRCPYCLQHPFQMWGAHLYNHILKRHPERPNPVYFLL
jgi:hypothetical protein